MSERSSSLATAWRLPACAKSSPSVRSAVMRRGDREEPRLANNRVLLSSVLAGEVRASDIMAVSGHE